MDGMDERGVKMKRGEKTERVKTNIFQHTSQASSQSMYNTQLFSVTAFTLVIKQAHTKHKPQQGKPKYSNMAKRAGLMLPKIDR